MTGVQTCALPILKERQKACGMKAPRKYARPTYGAPPESFAKMIRKKSVSAKAITVQSQKCGIVCESNCIDEPAGENCHTEMTSQSFAPWLSRQTAPLGVELVSDCSIASMHLDLILPCFHCVCTAGISRVLSRKTLWSSNGFCVY